MRGGEAANSGGESPATDAAGAQGAPRRAARPTIADVAARAGVSPAAVSFAMNDRPGVAEPTRRRILAAADELGWRPSAHARALTEARARAIGLVLARPTVQLELDPFFLRFLAGVETALARADHALVMRVTAATNGPELGLYERLAAAGQVDGFLLTDPELDDPRFELLAATGLPVVVAGNPVSPCPFPFVETDHARGIAAMVEHLLALGHRHVAFVGGFDRYEHVQARLRVWHETLAAAGVEPGPVAHANPGDPAGTTATARVLAAAPRPTAIVFGSDVLAVGGLGAARERGIEVPRELSIGGFDDSPLAALASPPLTSVRVDYAGFGEAAAAALLASIAGEPAPEFRPAPPELVVRASSAPLSIV
jgi:LacI family repressor for deo operon, udp, cdd, tsx, nupC, and nupG